MTSPLLALFARSMREDVRAKLTYWARTGLVLTILLFLFVTQAQMGWSNAPGLRFFGTVMVINCCFIVLAGLSYFASAITEEKEEMTLGLLRMTNLNPLSILLGKSTSRVLGALLLLAAQFPFTLLAVSLGGVSIGQIVASYCTLGAFIVFLSNLALLFSVICRRSGAAAFWTGIVLFASLVIVPIANWFIGLARTFGATTADAPWVTALHEVAAWFALMSPFKRLTEILRTGFAESPWCLQVGSNLALGAGCFLLAWAVFDLFCNEQPEAGPARGAVARRTSVFRRTGAGRVWKRALAWKDFYFVTGGKATLAVKFLVYAIPVAAMRFWPKIWGGPADWDRVGQAMLGWVTTALVAELSFAAARVFRVERQWKTLPALATLPMSMRRVAYQKLLGCVPALIPCLTYLAFGVFLAWDSLARDLGSWDAEGGMVIAYVITQAVFFLHLVVLLSLHLKRGALAAALALHFLLQMFGALLFNPLRNEEVGLVVGTIILAVITFVLHVQIGVRLEALAAEE